MDNRVYLWLFSNINKYDFAGNEAIEIKNSISRMIITEESLSSEQIMNQMRIHYERFISSFYNNIYGYKNGFACKAITSAHLDCYFVKTPDGFVPIGFYKQIRPAETVMLVNNYLEQAKNDIKNEKNQLISAWQNEINDISFKYDRIEKDKTPSVAKAILGGVAALILLAFVIFSFINLDIVGAVLTGGQWVDVNIPLISNAGFIGFALYIIFAFAALAIAVLDIIFTIKEIMLLASKSATKNLLETILPRVSNLEQNIQFGLNQGNDDLVDASRRGENIIVTQSKSAFMINEIKSSIRNASAYVNKPRRKRKGIGLAWIIISFIIVLIGAISYIEPLADAMYGLFSSGESNVPPIHTEEPTEEPSDIPKESSYTVIKNDSTWLQANSSASNSGGYLVCIKDREEFDKVCKMAEEKDLIVFWVGASRDAYEEWNDITWEDGTEFSFRPWLPGEPSNYSEAGNREDYLMAFKVGDDWYLNDSENNAIIASGNTYKGKVGFIIEYEG